MISYENRSEKELNIPLSDGKMLHAVLRGELHEDTPVVIMMHGLPGSGNELLQYLGAHYISEQGITTLRLSMYDFGKQYRRLLDCTLNTHIADFEDVVRYLRDKSIKKIFALGHSYGGITILGSKIQLDGAVLWDPSHGLAWAKNNKDFDDLDFPQETVGNIVIGTGGYGYLYSKAIVDEEENLGDTTDWAVGKNYPIKFILAAAGPLAKYAKRYYDVASDPKAVVEIEGAHHQFEDNDEVTEQLFVETVAWIQQFSL